MHPDAWAKVAVAGILAAALGPALLGALLRLIRPSARDKAQTQTNESGDSPT